MSQQELPDMSMDSSSLFQEETFTDAQVGSIRVMTPIKTDGSRDESRRVRYTGSTQIMSSAGPLPLSFEIEADSLEDAVAKFGENAQAKLEETMQQLEEMRREQASGLITPGQGGGQGGGMGGGMGQGGAPGGGIQMP